MDRRDFIRSGAAAGVAAVLPTIPAHAATSTAKTYEPRSLRFRPDGTFKILQFTDTHYIADNAHAARAMRNVIEMLEMEKPDLVIHTGDVIFGKPTEKSLRDILAPIAERKIPFAVAMGNHDGQYELSRKEVFDVIKTIPYNINQGVEGLYGDTNDIISILPSKGGEKCPKWVLYLFDSGDSISDPDMKGYDYIHYDQIDWYRRQSKAFQEMNGGEPVPSLAFFHIPVPEFTYGLRYDTHRDMKGNLGEDPSPANVNSGLFVAMKEQRDVQAIICGHDHDNDYAMKWRGMFLIYGRYSGGDTVYNHLKPNGARIIQLTEGEPGFRSWVRLYGGVVQQELRYPDSFRTFK